MTSLRRVLPLLAAFLALQLVLSQCASPPPKVVEPVIVPEVVEPLPPPPKPPEIDDDHRLVSKTEFLEGSWAPLPALSSWTREGNGLGLTLEGGKLASVQFLTTKSFRLWFPPANDVSPSSPGPRTWPEGRFDLTVSETPTHLVAATSDLEWRLDKATLACEVRSAGTLLWKTPSGPMFLKKRLKQEFSMAAQPIWTGLGTAGLSPPSQGFDKSGQWVKLWAGPNAESGPWGIPFLLAAGANGPGAAPPFGVLIDSSYQSYIQLDPAKAFFGTLNGGLDLVFWTGKGPGEVIAGLTTVVGRTPRSPAWATTAGFVLPDGSNGDFLRRAKLSVGQVRQGNTSEAEAKALEAAHFSVGLSPSPSWALGQAVDTSSLVPGEALWDTTFDDRGLKSLLARSNNPFAVWGAQKAAEAQRAAFPSFRPWNTWQTGFTGSSRWGAPEILATAGVDDQLTLDKVLSAGLSGLGTALIRLDVRPLADPAKAPAAWRGLQMALLNPYLVLDAGPDPLSWWLSLTDKDKKLFKAVLDRRSTLKPTMVEVLRQAAPTGVPALRPLLWSYASDPKVRAIRDEFLLGDNLLIAPAVDGNPTRKVYLPGGGVWFQFPAGEEFSGGQAYDLPTSPDFPLVFTKAGGFVAVREAEVFDDKATYNPLTFHVYPGGVGKGRYSVDDGLTRDDERGLITTVDFQFSYRANSMEISSEVVDSGPRMRYSDPYVLFRLHKVYNPKTVKIDNKVIPKYGDSFGITDTDRSAAWYENDNTLLIKLFNPEKGQVISLEFPKSP
ncbi:MAG: hypothetical protein WCG80_12035 [Spirochaetales bacterium]